jgi:hypothetical protein
MSEVDIKEVVRERYAEIARNVRAPGSSCCYDGESGSEGISANLYAADETKCLPQDAVTASLGCGNPSAGQLPLECEARRGPTCCQCAGPKCELLMVEPRRRVECADPSNV